LKHGVSRFGGDGIIPGPPAGNILASRIKAAFEEKYRSDTSRGKRANQERFFPRWVRPSKRL